MANANRKPRTSFIMFFPTIAKSERKVTELVESFAEKCSENWQGILLVPGGKGTVALRKKLAALGNERGFAVFAAEPSVEATITTSRSLRAANGVFVAQEDETHPVLGWAEITGTRLTVY